MNILEKYDKPLAYISVIFNLSLAIQAYILWSKPAVEEINKIYTIAILMGFEFVMVHSGVFMAAFPKKYTLYFFVPFYGLFALAMNASVEGNTVLILYLVVVINRMRFAFSDVNEQQKNKATLMSVFAALAWFFLISIFAINANRIPLLGITKEYLVMSNYTEVKKTGGILTDMPQVALSFAVVYYFSLAVIEFFLIKAFTTKNKKNVLKKNKNN